MIILLCGMHRSGTSMFARYLHETGISMGDELYEDRTTNPFGHYEDVEFLELQREEVARVFNGTDYLVTRDLEPSQLFRERARTLLEARRRRHGDLPWGWKDPRSTLFLDFWREELPDVRVVGMLRSPRRVVSSLCARLHGYFSIAKKDLFLRTYRAYNEKLLEHARRHPDATAIVQVERLAAEPERVLDELSAFLGLRCDHDVCRQHYDPSVMSRFRRPLLAFNARAFREAQAVHDELSSLAL
jgi:hypothetical protein